MLIRTRRPRLSKRSATTLLERPAASCFRADRRPESCTVMIGFSGLSVNRTVNGTKKRALPQSQFRTSLNPSPKVGSVARVHGLKRRRTDRLDRQSGRERRVPEGALVVGGQAESVSLLDELCNGACLHLSHDIAPVSLHGDLTDPKLARDLLVQQTRGHQGHDFALATA